MRQSTRILRSALTRSRLLPSSSILSRSTRIQPSPISQRAFIQNRPRPQSIPFATPLGARFNSSLTVPGSDFDPSASETKSPPPSYQLTFTCKPCGHRSAHVVSKQGYHKGTVLITCPSCKNRHVISDHLKIFMDEKSTLEDILRRASKDGDLSKLMKKGRLGMRDGSLVGNEGEEDIEFWEDGSQTSHVSARAEGEKK